MKFLAKLFSRGGGGAGRTVDELAVRLGVDPARLRALQPVYHEFTIPKRSGGTRNISAPDPELKTIQRLILHRLLKRLKAHPAAMGFERGKSIVTNACIHAGRAVVVKMDISNFFASTKSKTIQQYFEAIGWNREAAKLLVGLCCHRGGLPQGSPTSPRLSNLVNYKLDVRLEKLAAKLDATYTRYADDLTFSFAQDDRKKIHELIGMTGVVLADHDYDLHLRRKLEIRRQYEQQRVTGLVVNAGAALPRKVRRWLRAVEHRAAKGGQPTLTLEQLQGWRALSSMIAEQGGRR